MAAASSGALESAPAVTTELSICRGLDAPGAWPLSAQFGAGASFPSWALLASACPWGRPDPGMFPWRPVLPGLRCWICTPGRAAASPQLPPEPLRAAPGPAVRAAALRELGALSRGAGVC